MPQTLTNLMYHFVFSTKYRRPWITSDIEIQLYNYIRGIIRGEKGVLLAIGGMPDHIHLAVKLRAHLSVSDMLRKIKSNSSKWVHEKFKNKSKFAWQNGFAAYTVSESQLEYLIRYIHNQKRHHG